MAPGGSAMALISTDSLERVKQTADIVEVISAHTDLRRQGTRWVGLCPFHEERTPVVLRRRLRKALPLLRLRGRRRHDQVRRREGGAELRRRGRAARRPLRRRPRARERGPAGRGAPPAAPPAGRAARPHRGLLRRLPLGLRRGRQGPPLHGRARPRRGDPARLRRRLRAERLGHGPPARPAGGLQGRRAARGGAGAARAQRRRVRPLPLADHLPDQRPPRAHPGLRRTGDALRPGRQVRQHGGDRLLPQEPDALRDRPGEGGDRQGRPRGRRRGLHRRARPAPGRGSRRRSG